jgi:hypothetical protein
MDLLQLERETPTMASRILLVFLIQVAFLALGVSAGAVDLADDYIAGEWAIGEVACSDRDAERLHIDENGTVTSTTSGKVQAMGFWHLDAALGLVDLHLVASPSFFHDKLSNTKDTYGLYHILLFPLDVKADGFDGVGRLGDQTIKDSFTRCK